MTSQPLSRRMMRTNELDRRRFELVAAEFLVRMGDRIRTQREKLGLSRPDVARLMPGKVSENQIYRWELGKHQPNPDTLEALARVLQCDVGDFMASAPVKEATPIPLGSNDDGQLTEVLELLRRLDERLTVAEQDRLDAQAETLDRAAAILTQLDGIEAAIQAIDGRRRRTA